MRILVRSSHCHGYGFRSELQQLRANWSFKRRYSRGFRNRSVRWQAPLTNRPRMCEDLHDQDIVVCRRLGGWCRARRRRAHARRHRSGHRQGCRLHVPRLGAGRGHRGGRRARCAAGLGIGDTGASWCGAGRARIRHVGGRRRPRGRRSQSHRKAHPARHRVRRARMCRQHHLLCGSGPQPGREGDGGVLR